MGTEGYLAWRPAFSSHLRALSVQRNPILADVFHRTGLIERWGRGTNRVVAMCK
ncbi:MAG: ATP-binding protein, partial [Phycisphaerae bacterium]